jgi:hypothetical protein
MSSSKKLTWRTPTCSPSRLFTSQSLTNRNGISKLLGIPKIDCQESVPPAYVAVPEFVNLLRSSGIHFEHGGPVRQPYSKYRPARPHKYMLAE